VTSCPRSRSVAMASPGKFSLARMRIVQATTIG
jgi:hypothetical protein